jgi:adenine-specific DNA-methyltransferase
MDKLKFETKSGAERNIDRLQELAELFPEVITESRDKDGNLIRVVDFDKLKGLLGEVVDGRAESYDFTWVGKREALIEAGAPIRKTLRPVRIDETVPSGSDSNGKPYLSSGIMNFDTTQNLYIEGDNLDVLKLLTDSYLGKIKMIYIDPPYNTGKDFVYNDKFTMSQGDYDDETERVDADGNVNYKENLATNPRFHSDWCSMIYARLKVARNLLTDDGVICISIDDNEVENLKKICDEVFGSSNFIAQLIWKSKSGGANDSRFFAVDHEHVVLYAKNASNFKLKIDTEATVTTSYNQSDERGNYSLDRLDKQSIRYSLALDYEIKDAAGNSYFPQHKDKSNPNATWRWGKETVKQRFDELVFKDGNAYTKNYEKDGAIARSLLLEDRFGRTRTGKTDVFELFNINLFNNPKPYKLVRYLAMIITNKDDLILDFFSGSATTAHAVMQVNAEDGGKRKFICVQFPEQCSEKDEVGKTARHFLESLGMSTTVCEIGKERIRRAGARIAEINRKTSPNIDTGFRVFKLDESNFKDVHFSAGQLASLSIFDALTENLKPDRTAEDLLYSCILEWGLSLSLPHTEETIEGKKIFVVNCGDLIACFEKDLPESVIKAIAARKPLNALFRENCFKDSPAKINNEEIFKLISPSTKVRVL